MINLRTGIKKFDSASVDLSYRASKEGANGWEPNHRNSMYEPNSKVSCNSWDAAAGQSLVISLFKDETHTFPQISRCILEQRLVIPLIPQLSG